MSEEDKQTKNLLAPGRPETEVAVKKASGPLAIQQKVADLVDRVENPQGQEARATFGYRPTAAEKQASATRHQFFELSMWVVALMLVVGIVALKWGDIRAFFNLLLDSKPTVEVTAPSEAPSQVVSSIFEGQAHQIAADKGWLHQELFDEIVYYEAGKVVSGEYAGATRFWAVGIVAKTHVLKTYEFWQLADGQVLLTGGKPQPLMWLSKMQDYYLNFYVNTEKVQFADQIMGDFPQILPVSETGLLYRRDVLTDLGPYDGVVTGAARLKLTLSASEYVLLPALQAYTYADLKFYVKKYVPGEELLSQLPENLNDLDEPIAEEYLSSGTKVVVTDKTGVGMVYELVYLDEWQSYQDGAQARDLVNLEFYKQELIKYTGTASFREYKASVLAGDETVSLPVGVPTVPTIEPGLPGFSYEVTDFEFSGEAVGFASYISAFTPDCVPRIDTKVVEGITARDLTQIGTIFRTQTPIYRLVDERHPLYVLAYNLKFAESDLTDDELACLNLESYITLNNYQRSEASRIREGKQLPEIPTYDEYISKVPLLFAFDPWGRVIAVWENDLDFLAKCARIPLVNN